jgi:hypothetical protein
LGQSVEHLVCSPNSKGLTNLLKNAKPPAKKIDRNQHKNNWAQSKSGFVPKINQNNKKIGCFERKMDFGLVGDKTGNLGFWVSGDGWVRWRRADGGVSVVGEVDAGGGLGLFGF